MTTWQNSKNSDSSVYDFSKLTFFLAFIAVVISLFLILWNTKIKKYASAISPSPVDDYLN